MVNDELECIQYEAAITYSQRCSGIYLEGLINTTEDRSQDGVCPEDMWIYARSEPVSFLDIFWMRVLIETVIMKASASTRPPQ